MRLQLASSLLRQHSHLLRDCSIVNAIASAACLQSHRLPAKVDSGLSSFFLASTVSSLLPGGLQVHPLLEKLSWTVILQSALILGIWSTGARAKPAEASLAATQGAPIPSTSSRRGRKLLTMLVAFAIGCAGSILGTLVGAGLVSRLPPSVGASAQAKAVWPIAAACLAASYIGGTANFFETASALGAAGPAARTLSLIAGADILAMVLYFSVLLGLRARPDGVLSLLSSEDGSSSSSSGAQNRTEPLVLLAEELSPATLEALGPGCRAVRCNGADRGELLQALRRGADAVLVRSATKMDAEAVAAAKAGGLRIIARAGVGVDNVDIAAATAAGILVVNAPTSNSVSTAEHACALLLACARCVAPAHAALRAGTWARAAYSSPGRQGVELQGKTLGLVGLGRVGQLVAARMRAFGMTVIAYDHRFRHRRAARLGVRLVTLDALLRASDFISLHVPETGATIGLINAAALDKCKEGVRIINCARGAVVDEAALLEALRSGRVAGAGLDVFAVEPCTDSPLLQLDNVVATPHLGAATPEAQERAGRDVAVSVRRALAGGGAVPGALNQAGITAAARAAGVASESAAGSSSGARVSVSVGLSLAIASLAVWAQAGPFRGLPGVSVVISVLAAVAAQRAPLSLGHGSLALAGPQALARANDYAMCLFYASIGLGCRVQDARAVGLPVLALMSAALAVHLGVVLAACSAWNYLHAGPGQDQAGRRISLDTAIVASNACVGGAATAASMAASMPGADPDLPLLGSIAGIIGYIVGTPLGLTVARILR